MNTRAEAMQDPARLRLRIGRDKVITYRVIKFRAAAHDAATPHSSHVSKEIVMSTLQRIAINAVTALLLGTIGVPAGELPKYELAGFPISPVQVAVLGSDRIQEQSPTPTLTLNGMPASPHQIAVLHHRTKRLTADKFNKNHT